MFLKLASLEIMIGNNYGLVVFVVKLQFRSIVTEFSLVREWEHLHPQS